jgi:iron complex transport system ATP-binding protein
MTMPALAVSDLAIGYRSSLGVRTVARGINLCADEGRLVCLLGANGTGKSTLLRTLTRLQSPLSGSVTFAGTPIGALSARDLAVRVAVVLTDRIVIDAISVRRLVELGRFPYTNWLGVLSSVDRSAVTGALTAVGAADLADRIFNELSDGERQRAMIARALAQQPRVLLLDEPTAFLDAAARVELWALLRRLATGRRLTVVVATHDLDLALSGADHIWLMADGAIREGSPAALIETGAIAAAFEREHVRFDRGLRAFRFVDDVDNERMKRR